MLRVIFREASKGVYMGGYMTEDARRVSTFKSYTLRGKAPARAPQAAGINNFLPASIAPYEKSLYVRTSFSIRFCSSEQ